MAGIIRREFHVFAAESFVDEMNTDNTRENNLYMAIGKDTVWPGEPTPDPVDDSDTQQTSFWTDVKAMAVVGAPDVTLVVPRKDWVSGIVLEVFDPSLAAVTAYAKNFYVRNALNQVYQVMTAGVSSLIEPTGTVDIPNDGNGNSFRYLYTIKPQDSLKFLTEAWMPVEFEDNYTLGDPLNNHLVLGAKYAMIYGQIGSPIPTNFSYRKVGIVRNALLNDNADDTLKSKASALTYSTFTDLSNGSEATKVIRGTGELMYADNRGPINRDTQQSEKIRLILVF